MKCTSALVSLAMVLALPCFALAQSEPYPNRPVRLIAPAAPGGNPDVLGRLLAQRFTETLGKPFVVENIPGAGGVVAANMVAKAPPDGHMLMLADSGALAINPALNPNISYDPLKDFARSLPSLRCRQRSSCIPAFRPTRPPNSSRWRRRTPAS